MRSVASSFRFDAKRYRTGSARHGARDAVRDRQDETQTPRSPLYVWRATRWADGILPNIRLDGILVSIVSLWRCPDLVSFRSKDNFESH
jgi:hypothetical protein